MRGAGAVERPGRRRAGLHTGCEGGWTSVGPGLLSRRFSFCVIRSIAATQSRVPRRSSSTDGAGGGVRDQRSVGLGYAQVALRQGHLHKVDECAEEGPTLVHLAQDRQLPARSRRTRQGRFPRRTTKGAESGSGSRRRPMVWRAGSRPSGFWTRLAGRLPMLSSAELADRGGLGEESQEVVVLVDQAL